MSLFPVDRMKDIVQAPSEFQLMEKVPLTRADIQDILPFGLRPVQPQEQLCPLVFMDINTTGSDPAKEFIIEMALVRCTYSISYHDLVSVDMIYHEYEDTVFELSEEVQSNTHITKSMLKGHRFEESRVRRLLADSPLVIAFKPEMVRPFFERKFPIFADLSWGSAGSDVDWKELGCKSHRLQYIMSFENFFYDYYSAKERALALAYLMTRYAKALEAILAAATLSSYVIEAKNFPFEGKDRLKELGFKWDKDKRLWKYFAKTKEDLDRLWPDFSAIDPKYNKAMVFQITARERFKNN